MATSLSRFDYTSLEPAAAKRVANNATLIRDLVNNTAVSIVEVGELLIETHTLLGPTEFSRWAQKELHWSQSTCSNVMAVARRFGDLPSVKGLDVSALYALAREAVPQPAVKEALSLAAKGDHVSKAKAVSIIRRHMPPAERKPPPDALYNARWALRKLIEQLGAGPVADELAAIVDALRTDGKLPWDREPQPV